jgi:DNA-directed RNA polymerase specialized sigma24 family protein
MMGTRPGSFDALPHLADAGVFPLAETRGWFVNAEPMSAPLPDDARWFAAEVQPHDAALRGWLRTRFPALGEVDDLVQETYTRVLQIRARDPLCQHAVKPLLFTTARNLALDELRRRQIVPMFALPDDADAAVFADDAPGGLASKKWTVIQAAVLSFLMCCFSKTTGER